MAFDAYKGISNKELSIQHTTSTGETYTLKHDERLKVDMVFLGQGESKANAQGWERDNSKYFSALSQNNPEMFSKKNLVRIQSGHAPVVDQKMIDAIPEWEQFRNQRLIHHHIGGDGEAVALPQNMHKGHGEIHNIEKEVGITGNCKKFSEECQKHPEAIGKTSSFLHSKMKETKGEEKAPEGRESRSDAVRKSTAASQNSSSSSARMQAVQNAGNSRQVTDAQNRAAAVENGIREAGKQNVGHSLEKAANKIGMGSTIW